MEVWEMFLFLTRGRVEAEEAPRALSYCEYCNFTSMILIAFPLSIIGTMPDVIDVIKLSQCSPDGENGGHLKLQGFCASQECF